MFDWTVHQSTFSQDIAYSHFYLKKEKKEKCSCQDELLILNQQLNEEGLRLGLISVFPQSVDSPVLI